MPLVHVAGLNKFYTGGTARLHVLRDLEVDVAEGEMVAVVGASGVGKSTLLHLLGGLDRADSGVVEVSGPAARRSERFGTGGVPQPPGGVRVPVPPPAARVHRARERRDADADRRRAAGRGARRATELLSRVGLAERAEHRPSMMSGGEQQRVAVARALVMRPALLLADEPTGDLDEPTAESLHALLRQMHAEHGLTSVIATHNPKLAHACDRILRLEGGQLKPA
jgi:lipoprotein-releasing system ATP-binding protein